MSAPAPNHHADYPGFRGLPGLLAALVFTVGRGPVARLAADRTEVGAGDHVVDVGSGPGTAVREARRRGATATAVDPAAVMLRVGRLLSPAAGITWARGSAEALPVPDGGATVVWSLATVHHWRDLDRGLAEVHRVLRPGGRFLVTERRVPPGARGHGSHGWIDDQAEAFAAACRTVGLADVTVSTSRPGDTTILVVTARRA
jgi:ubiquinone/menaquinone biosynthesis C-methylase UbiE